MLTNCPDTHRLRASVLFCSGTQVHREPEMQLRSGGSTPGWLPHPRLHRQGGRGPSVLSPPGGGCVPDSDLSERSLQRLQGGRLGISTEKRRGVGLPDGGAGDQTPPPPTSDPHMVWEPRAVSRALGWLHDGQNPEITKHLPWKEGPRLRRRLSQTSGSCQKINAYAIFPGKQGGNLKKLYPQQS